MISTRLFSRRGGGVTLFSIANENLFASTHPSPFHRSPTPPHSPAKINTNTFVLNPPPPPGPRRKKSPHLILHQKKKKNLKLEPTKILSRCSQLLSPPQEKSAQPSPFPPKPLLPAPLHTSPRRNTMLESYRLPQQGGRGGVL